MNQRMKVAVGVVLVAVLAAVSLYLARDVQQVDKTQQVQRAHDKRLISPFALSEQLPDGGYPAMRYEKLTVTLGDEVTKLERRSGHEGWWVVSPLNAPASQTVVGGLVQVLEEAELLGTVEEAPDAAALTKYGFDHPRFVVEAVAKVGLSTRTVVLRGGKANAYNDSVFVQRNAEQTIFAAPGDVDYKLALPTAKLREARVLGIREVDVRSIDSKGPRGRLALQRRGIYTWDLVTPLQEPADGRLVAEMILTPANEKAIAFPVDGAEQRQALGLETPYVDTRLTMADNEVYRLRISRLEGDAGVRWFALFETDEQVNLAEFVGPNVAAYDRDPLTLRDRLAVRFDRSDVAKLVLRDGAGGEVRLEKQGDAWRVTSPSKLPANSERVDLALQRLSDLRAVEVSEAHPKDWHAFGLSDGSRSIEVTQRDGGVARLTVGSQVPGRSNHFFVRGPRELVLVAESNALVPLPSTLGDVVGDGGVP
jgi:Domain of unknown function (DUF4340)